MTQRQKPEFVLHTYTRQALTVGSVLALVVAVAGTVFGVIDAASDVYGDRPWGNGMLIGPAIVVGFSTVQLAWKGTNAVLQQWGGRVIGLNIIATIACTAAFAVTYPFVTVIFGKRGYQYWFSEGWDVIVFPSLLGFAFGLLAGLAAFVFVVLPSMALRKPQQLASANMLDTDPRYAERNRRAGLLMVPLIVIVFLAPTLIIAFDGIAQTIGWVLIPVALALAAAIAVTQKTDRARRRAAGVSSRLDKMEDARESTQ